MTPAKKAAVVSAVATLRGFDEFVRVRCYLNNDDVRDLALPAGRYRWKRLAQSLEAYEWVRLEVLAKDGAVLGVYDHPDGSLAGELEGLPTRASKISGELSQIVTLFLHGQKQALDQQYRLVEVATTAQTAALESAVARLASVEDSMSALMRLLRRATTDSMELSQEAAALIAEHTGGDGDGDGGEMGQLKAAVLVQLAQKLLPGLIGGGGGGGGGTPPANGAAS